MLLLRWARINAVLLRARLPGQGREAEEQVATATPETSRQYRTRSPEGKATMDLEKFVTSSLVSLFKGVIAARRQTMDRLSELVRFCVLLDRLEQKVGGKRTC